MRRSGNGGMRKSRAAMALGGSEMVSVTYDDTEAYHALMGDDQYDDPKAGGWHFARHREAAEAPLRAEIAAKDEEIARLREALKVLQDLPIIENDKPNTLHLKGKEHTGEVVDYLFYVIRKVKEVARAALAGESND